MIEVLLRVNADLNARANAGSVGEDDRIRKSPSNPAAALQHPRSTVVSPPDSGSSTPRRPPLLQSPKVTGSPKARRILGLEAFSQTQSYGGQRESASILRREETISTLSTRFARISPKARKLPLSQSSDALQKLGTTGSNIKRTTSLSGARSLVATLVGGDKTRDTPVIKPGRTEKYLRGILDILQQPFVIPKMDELKTARGQTRSAPAGRKVFAPLPVTPDSRTRKMSRPDHAQSQSYLSPTFRANDPGRRSGLPPPALHSTFTQESGLQCSKSF